MTGAREDVFFRPVKYRASGVRAESAEREKPAFRRMQQETRMLGVWVRNDFHPANGDIIYTRHHSNGIRIFPGANVNGQPTKSCGQAGGREVFCKPSAGKLLVVRTADKTSPV
jgi:hypothetical protein